MKEELTTKMHSELKVSEQKEIEHRAWTAQDTIEKGLYTMEEALKWYELTQEQYNKFKDSWKA